jgi:soluble lytic murein transglycosylase-like protein
VDARTRKALAVGAAIAIPGGIVLGAYLWSRREGSQDDDDGARSVTGAGLLAEARARLFGGDGAELAARILAATPGSAAAAYAEEIGAAADAYNLDPLLIVAVGDRESGWGFASGYTPQGGPDGAGDRKARPRKSPPSSPALARFYRPGPDGQPGTLVAPSWPNGAIGFGLGLMQIDSEFNWEWANGGTDTQGQLRWAVPAENITKGAAILRGCIDQLGDVRAGVAAYNAGVGAVRRVLAAGGDVDAVTSGRNYSADVLARFDNHGGDRSALA